LKRTLRLLLMATAALSVDVASAAQGAAFDKCSLYGFRARSRAYARCRMNLRHFWTTGPCGERFYALTHREYCHLNPPPFI